MNKRLPCPAAIVLAVVAAVALPSTQGQRQTGSGLVVGQVVDGQTGKPVNGAIVAIGGVAAGRARILTDPTGRFVFRDLPPGPVTLAATKQGYAGGAYGQRRPGGQSQVLVLGPDERVGDVSLAVWKHAVVGGTLVDETGERLVRVQVRAWRRTVVAGQHRLAPAGIAFTDDRGIYRIGGLLPGDYIVAASAHHAVVPSSVDTRRWGPAALQARDLVYHLGGGVVTPPPPDERFSLYPATYFPGSSDPGNALVVSLRAGEERLSVDLQLHPVATVRVAGTLTSPDGNVAFQTVRLIPDGLQSTASEADVPTLPTDAKGAFVFPAVPPGQYTLRSTTTVISSLRSVGGLVWAAVPLQVGATDIDGLTVPLLPALRITGRVEFEGSSPWPSAAELARIPLLVEPADGEGELGPIPVVRVGEDGEFSSTELVGGRYVLRVTDSPVGWMFKSATLGGRDISSSPIDLNGFDASGVVITFTNRWSALSGMVQNRSRNPDADALVVVFPTDRQLWTSYGLTSRRIKGVRTGRYGEYAFSSVPPGDYYVTAVPDDQADGWQDPDLLEQLSRGASHVTVGEGEQRRIDLRTREIR